MAAADSGPQDGEGGLPRLTQVMPMDLASVLSTVALAALPILVLQALWRRCSRRSGRVAGKDL